MVETKEEVRVRELLERDALAPRSVLGQVISNRVGARSWNRPNVAISSRIYEKYGLDDPWGPGRSDTRRSVGLGPVGLRLTEPRRQVAPHLKPKMPKKKVSPRAADPLARWRKKEPARRASNTPTPPPTPAASPPPRAPEPPSPFGRKPRHELKGKLPVRPDLEMPRSVAGTSTASEGAIESDLDSPSGAVKGTDLPGPPGPVRRRASSSARFRMRGQHIKSEPPRITGGPSPKKESAPDPVVVDTPCPPIDRAPPKSSMGMDDLFGASGDSARMRVRRDRSDSGSNENENG